MKHLKTGLALTLILSQAGYLAKKEYDYRADKEYVIDKDVNFVSSLGLQEFKFGEPLRKDGEIEVVMASQKEFDETVVPKGYIVEPLMKYQATAFKCSEDPTPIPTPPTTAPPWPTNSPTTTAPGSSQVVDWSISTVHALEAQKINDASNIKVCMLDTGIDKTHPDLKYVDGYNFTTSNAADFQDRAGHGSHTAGAVAAVNNSFGVVGASQAKLYIGKVLGDDGSGYNSWIANGIRWCADQKADIISMSLGGPQASSVILNAIYYARQMGTEIFAAAGNDSSPIVGYPAGYRVQGLYSISALDQNLSIAYFSNFGKVEFACPGVNTLSTVPGGGYQRMSGTSMATPVCAGVAALFKARGFPYKARDLGSSYYFGAGMLDASLIGQ